MAGILKITPNQVKAFKKVGRPDLIDRIDRWLCVELESWNRAELARRHLIIDQICDVADDAEFEIEVDFAMLCYAVLNTRSQWKDRLYSGQWQAVLSDFRRNPSAKARELYLLSEAAASPTGRGSHDTRR